MTRLTAEFKIILTKPQEFKINFQSYLPLEC